MTSIRVKLSSYWERIKKNFLPSMLYFLWLNEIACEALNRLGIRWEMDKAMQDYNSGRSTQLPVNPSVKLKTRFRRTIQWEGMRLKYG